MSSFRDRIQDHVIWRHATLAAGVAAVINALVYLIADAQGWIPDELPEAVEQFSLVSTIIASIIPAFVAGLLLVILARNIPEPSRMFNMVCLVALLIAIVAPFAIGGIPDSLQYVLLTMHVIAAAVIIGFLTTAVRR